MCTISYISELAGYTLKVFLMKSYSIPEDSYTMDLFLILCRFPFIIIQMMIIYEIYQFTKKKDKSDIYEFTKKIDKSDIYKYTTLNTAYFYLNDSNKSKVSKAEWTQLENSIKNLYIASLLKDYNKEGLLEQNIALEKFISIDTKIKLKLISYAYILKSTA